ncbi:hypothetical protein ACH4TE_26620 [Streptomyces sioyaensis]|uniref:hypothetical protein n=1 Tax=Streptomyces sioyaensis TaxID=67364 RepID=UPI0037B8AFAA
MGQHGGHVTLFPSWVPQQSVIDITWDDAKLSDPQPKDKWWGELALFGRTGSNEGEWQWTAAEQKLGLWVPVPAGGDGYRRLVATLYQFTFPLTNGMTGTGSLQPGLAPTAGELTLTWRGDAH